MTDVPVTLFPHTWITPMDLAEILTRFRHVNICIPWFMDIPQVLSEKKYSGRIRVLRPTPDQKPEGEFRKLLAEYKSWMSQHEDKGLYAFLSSCDRFVQSDETPWEIRQMIRRAGRSGTSDSKDPLALKWHLILHLARESEENRTEAEQILLDLKSGESPLAVAIGENPALPNILNDLPVFEPPFSMDKHLIRHVLEAWFGLFGEYVPDGGTLVTLNREITDYIEEVLEDILIMNSAEGKIHIPLLQDVEDKLKDFFPADLYGKTIIILEQQKDGHGQVKDGYPGK